MTDRKQTCANCRFWVPTDGKDSWSQLDRDFGYCEQTPFREDMREWSKAGGQHFDIIPEEYANRTAYVEDAEMYSATLRTKAEHFCAMFAAKEAGA
jgi:hypothetical protein